MFPMVLEKESSPCLSLDRLVWNIHSSSRFFAVRVIIAERVARPVNIGIAQSTFTAEGVAEF